MTRPIMDVNGSAYLEIIKQRQLQKEFKQYYPHMKWALEVLDNLEKKTIFSQKDYVDLTKAKTIINFVTMETKKETLDKHTTPKYTWRTRGDGKVRSRHAKFNGKIFSWDSPPEGGYHPGEDFGCRCIAEPYKSADNSIREYVEQTLVNAPTDSSREWDAVDYSYQYYHTNGKPVKLHEMGILKQIIGKAKWNVYPKVERLIFEKVQRKGAGKYPFRWNDSYRFHTREFAIGGATVTLNATLEVEDMGYTWKIKGILDYDFYDKFTDIFDLINVVEEDYNPPGSTPFDITDEWSTSLEAVILKSNAA